jgi:DNA topoisomerase-1
LQCLVLMKTETDSQHSHELNSEFAKQAGLHYVPADQPGLQRVRHGKSFRYLNSRGQSVKNEKTLERIRKLAIPPAYDDVWICPDPLGHLQMVGKDARGRKQYRYHQRWTETKGAFKYNRIIDFAQSLPKIRKQTSEHLKLEGLPREKVLATVVQLLEKTLIRVGNEEYAKTNHSYGLSTMQDHHVKVDHGKILFRFKGKSNIRHEISVTDPKLAEVVKKCREMPGHELFHYLDDAGVKHIIHSHDVNHYLQDITGKPFTAKDFRTWAGTVFAAVSLRELVGFKSATEAKRHLNEAIETVSKKLGNTKSICRKCYVHPAVMDSYLNGEVIRSIARRKHPITPDELHLLDRDEKTVLAFLRKKAKT